MISGGLAAGATSPVVAAEAPGTQEFPRHSAVDSRSSARLDSCCKADHLIEMRRRL